MIPGRFLTLSREVDTGKFLPAPREGEAFGLIITLETKVFVGLKTLVTLLNFDWLVSII